jgi:hypothetical protein
MPISTDVHYPVYQFLNDLEMLALKHSDINYDLCATYISPGIARDSGGFIILGGRLIRVPGWKPDSPEFAKAKVAVASAALAIASLMPPGEERTEVETSLFKSLGIEPPVEA